MTREERAAYALKRALECVNIARRGFEVINEDRADGITEFYLHDMRVIAQYRKEAADWFRRYHRTTARRWRCTESGDIVYEFDLIETFQSDRELRMEYPNAAAYVNACLTYQGGTLEEIR